MKFQPNPEQKQAIEMPLDVSYRVLAPPGSGKTVVAEQRIRYLFDNGVPPGNILYVTFSKTMADAGLERILKSTPELRGTEAEEQICTIHAICYRMLRWEGDRRRVAKEWQIKKYINELAEDIWWDANNRPGWKEIASWIDTGKAQSLSDSELSSFYHDALGSYHGSRLAKIYGQFNGILQRNNLITFSDMLRDVEQKLINDRMFREKYQARFQYVMVDEGQDTNSQAMRILTTLAKPQDNFFICSDIDQLLYRFTGATPEANAFEGFEKRYPDGEMIKLRVNYRSTQTIIETSQRSIVHNYSINGHNGPYDAKYLKNVQSRDNAPKGDSFTFNEYDTPMDEADTIAQELKQRIESGEYQPKDFFIGARTRAQLGYLEGPLVRAQVPFINIAGGSFWASKHVKDVISYLRLAYDNSDNVAFKRVYNIASNDMTVPWNKHKDYGSYCPHRWLGNAFLRECNSDYESIDNALYSRQGYKFEAGVDDLQMFMWDLDSNMDTPAQAIRFIIDRCYRKYLAHEEGIVNSDEAENGKFEDLETVIDVARDYSDVGKFLEYVSGAQKAVEDRHSKNWDKYVVLSTVHRLKGLERKVVFGIGISEGELVDEDLGISNPVGLLPHTFSLVPPPQMGVLPTGGKGRVEDERCIFYVLITRAKEEVHLSSIRKYRKYDMFPSRFIREIGLV